MEKTNFLICSGEACPLRLICRRFHDWIDNEDAGAEEMAPAFSHKTDDCEFFNQIDFFAC